MDVIVPQYITSSRLLSSSVADSTETTWSVSTTYALDATVKHLDTTGAEADIWKFYVSLVADNVGNNPESSPEKWVNQGAINRYKMFDPFIMTATTDTKDIEVVAYVQRLTSLAFLNVQASEIKLEFWNGTTLADMTSGNLLAEYTITLRQAVADWYGYFFDDFDNIRDVSTPLNYTMFYNMVVRMTFKKFIDPSVTDCFVGQVIAGRNYDIGKSRYGVQTGIEDYSKIVEDETFGSTYLQQGNYKKTMEVDLFIENPMLNTVNSILTQLRAVPTIWQANQSGTEYDNLLIYGFCKKFNIIMQGATHTECSLQIRGMI